MAQDPVVQEEGAEAPAPKSKKKLIIIIVAVLVLIGGGVGAWLAMSGGDEHAEGEEGEHEVVEVKDPVFLKLTTFTVNLNPEEGDKFLQVDITLSASSKAESDTIEAFMPQVRNRILMLLSSKLPSEIATIEGKKILSEELVQTINEPYTEGAEPLQVVDAFFTSFVIQ